VSAVHLEHDGRPACHTPAQVTLTTDRDEATCRNCLSRYRPVGYQWPDVKPCGTTAAYRRHLRRHGAPVRCETCLQAERRRWEDRKARYGKAA
jgi:hypothetical protein